MVDPFTYALREQILPIISNRLQGLLHAFSKQETNYMCEKCPTLEPGTLLEERESITQK